KSEGVGVTDVGGTAVGVVQVEVPRTTVVGLQLRITVTDVGGADGDGGVPRSLPGQLRVIGGIAAGVRSSGGVVGLAVDVVDVPGRGPVTEGPAVVQGGTQVRATEAAGEVDHRTTLVVHHVLVDPGHGQLVAQLTPVAQVEMGVDASIDALGGDRTLVAVASDDVVDRTAVTTNDGEARRDRTVGGRIQVGVDDVLGTDRRDRILDLDVVVVDRDVQPLQRIPHEADGPLGRLLRGQVRVGLEVGVDLQRAVVRLAQHLAGHRVVDRLGREGGLLGQDVQTRGTEALAVGTTEGQGLQRLPAEGNLRREVAAVVAVVVVTAGDGDVEGAGERQQPLEEDRLGVTGTAGGVTGRTQHHARLG